MTGGISMLTALPWFAWIAIAAIVSGGFTSVICALTKHRERMEMIRMGMHPDVPVQVGKPQEPYRETVEL